MSSETIPRRSWTAIYTRQSRSTAGDFSSCEAQLSSCIKFVMARLEDGWVWNGKRYDDEGQSGETLDRPGLQRLLADMRAGKIDRVVVHRLDRLSRRIADCTALLQELKDRKVALAIVTQPELNFGARQTLILNLMALFAEFEQEMIRDRLTETRTAMKRHGLRVAGAVPYGYVADAATKQLVVERREALRVRRMFEMAAKAKTPSDIAEVANRRGWRTKEWVSKRGNKTGGGRWTPRQILATLSNSVYIGQIHDGAHTRPGSHEAIVSVDLFHRVATIIQSRRSRAPGRQRAKISWPLRGLLKCGQCGRLMSPSQGRHGPIIYRYYRCRSHAGGRSPCVGVCLPARTVERYVCDVVADAEVGHLKDGDADAAKELRQALASTWSAMNEREQEKLLPSVVQEVVFHAKRSKITVTFNPDAVQQITGGSPTGQNDS
jgi:site-specific DNA recombinase